MARASSHLAHALPPSGDSVSRMRAARLAALLILLVLLGATTPNALAQDPGPSMAPYDSFTIAPIDQSRWLTLEQARQIESDKLPGAVGSISKDLPFADPSSVNRFSASVQVDEAVAPRAVLPEPGCG